MPTSHISEIVAVHPAIRRVTGSTDIPLTDKGIEHAQQVAEHIPKGAVIASSPMSRARETATIVSHGKAVKIDHSLAPWALGEHEGKPSEEQRPQMHKLITDDPDKNPGISEFSGKTGESFNGFRKRVLWGERNEIAKTKPGETKVRVTHGRNIRLVGAWLAKGAHDDLSVDKKEMLSHAVKVGTGALERVNMKDKRMEHVESAKEPGFYYMRHGDTEWNQQTAGQQETGS